MSLEVEGKVCHKHLSLMWFYVDALQSQVFSHGLIPET